MPQGVTKGKTKLTDEERKAKKRDYDQQYRISSKGKAARKKWKDKPETKAREKARKQSPEYKAKIHAYDTSPERKARKQSPEYKAKQKRWNNTPKRIAARKTRAQTPEFRVQIKKIQDVQRLKILQHYSKRLSNSDIPCCRCCGLNSNIAFLALDHIQGAKAMDSIPELTNLGYSSEKKQRALQRWIIDNNYLSDLKTEYFQILCHNCNHAKGHTKNKKCPMENKPH